MTTPVDPATPTLTASLRQRVRGLVGQDLGVVPVIFALVILVIYFWLRSGTFLTAENLTNLFIQAIVYILLGMAEVWLLLLGEIDLSLGWVAGLSGSLALIYTNVQFGWPVGLAILFGLAVSAAIGGLWGLIVIKIKVPSFIVTLAGLFIVQGVLLYILTKVFEGGGPPDQSNFIISLTQGKLTPTWTWILVIAVIAVSTVVTFVRERARRVAKLPGQPIYKIVVKLAGLALLGVGMAIVFNVNRSNFIVIRGMPTAVPMVFGIVVIYSFLLGRTKFGRYMYAIGGNPEAARRAGIPVNRYRVYAFMLGGLTAGIAGLFYVSRLGGYSTSSTDPTLVLDAVAAAVIGGTSLFGGRGRMSHPVIGGIILAVIANGLVLINVSPTMQYVFIGAVLLAAITVDSIARRAQNLR